MSTTNIAATIVAIAVGRITDALRTRQPVGPVHSLHGVGGIALAYAV